MNIACLQVYGQIQGARCMKPYLPRQNTKERRWFEENRSYTQNQESSKFVWRYVTLRSIRESFNRSMHSYLLIHARL